MLASNESILINSVQRDLMYDCKNVNYIEDGLHLSLFQSVPDEL